MVLRMLAKDPQERPTIAEVRSALQPWAPQPDDPEPRPRPRLDPDPTRPFRTVVEERPTRVPATARRDDEWLDARYVERLCDTARRELGNAEPGPALGCLAELAPRVRQEWGSRRPLVRDVWLLAAEGLRLLGDCGGAVELYDGLVGELVRGDAPPGHVQRAVLACAPPNAASRSVRSLLLSPFSTRRRPSPPYRPSSRRPGSNRSAVRSSSMRPSGARSWRRTAGLRRAVSVACRKTPRHQPVAEVVHQSCAEAVQLGKQ